MAHSSKAKRNISQEDTIEKDSLGKAKGMIVEVFLAYIMFRIQSLTSPFPAWCLLSTASCSFLLRPRLARAEGVTLP